LIEIVDLDGAYSSAVEHLPYKEGVAGSIPATPTTCGNTDHGLRITHRDPIIYGMAEPFQGLLASFQLALEAEGKSPRTIEGYTLGVTQLAEHLRRQGRADDVTQVTATDVREFLTALERAGAKPSTRYTRYSGCRQFFAWCVREDELDVSPMANMRPPKVPEPRIAMLTREQMKALLADCAGKDFVARRDTAIILLLADTGLRLSELTNLTMDDVDLRARVAYVIGKGRRPRTVPFGARVAQALDRYVRARRLHARADRPNLWLGEKNRPALTTEGVKQMLQRRGEHIGVRVHAHMFRHGFADAWLKSGGNESDLQELAGWKSAQMIRRYAAANRAERARDAHRRLSPMDAL
jgi:integrase/recombinase XerC